MTETSRGTAMNASPLRASLWRGASPAARIWVLTGLLSTLALLVAGLCFPIASYHPNWQLPWWAIAILFYGAESRVVHLHFRRGAHSFSLSEVPLVVGLLLAAPADLLIGNVVGVALALAYARRQPPVKLAFNVSTMLLSSALAVLVFSAAAREATSVIDSAPASWVAVFVAIVVSNLVGATAVAAAITLSEGRPDGGKLRQMLKISTTVAVTNASIALLAVTVVLADVRAVWLLSLPIVTLYLGYRAYIGERQQLESLEQLYESSRIIQRTPELDSALVALLEHSREMFRAERAEIVLYPSSIGDEFLRTAVGPGERILRMLPVPEAVVTPMARALEDGGRAFLLGTAEDDIVYAADQVAVRDAIVAPLVADGATVGFMLVVNRLGDISTFRPDDLKLFETVANHAGTALENGQLERSLAQLSTLKDELRHQAYHDALTQLANRHLFTQKVEEALESPMPGRVVSVLFVDLDDFKLVNDSFGHAVGDALLAEAASRITACLDDTDVAARLGGDEFGLLLLDSPRLDRSELVARQIIDALRQPYAIAGSEVSASASIGIASPAGTTTTDELLRHADMAMYDAKAGGKGRWAIFEPRMQLTMSARQDVSAELGRAVNRGEFDLLYQPIVALADGGIRGAEALMRWNHPRRGVVSPKHFIGVAEENNIIVPLGRWALGEACRQAQTWAPAADGSVPWVSVNISARQILHPSFVDDVSAAIASSGIEPSRLVLEVTESALLQDGVASARKLETVRSMGARIALDDFGTGFSSLSYVQRFPIDLLKIAQDFVQVEGNDHADWALAHAIISLGRSLSLDVVAEGVEHRQQLTQLKRLGCTLAQGYFFAQPLSADDIRSELGRTHAQHAGRGRQRLSVVGEVA